MSLPSPEKKERYGIERKEKGLQERYLRWVLSVDWVTPRYMMRGKMQRDKLRGRMGRRAWGYEKRLEERIEVC